MAVWTDRRGIVLGPLTTAWSMPDSCTIHIVLCPTCDSGYRGQQCSRTDGVEAAHDHTTCWPPATARAGTPTPAFFGWGFYSPGLACPTGYTTACTAQHGGRSEWDVQFTLVRGETAVGCCPEGFRCANRNGNTCVAVISTKTHTAVATGSCSGLAMVSVTQASFPDIITTTNTDTSDTEGPGPAGSIQTVTREMTLFAPMFQLNYQSSDLAPESPSTTAILTLTTSANLAATATAATAGSDTSDNTSPSDSSSAPAASEQSGLSTGAMAGIGVGAALGGILLLAVLGWLCWRRGRKRTAEASWSEAQTLKEEPAYQSAHQSAYQYKYTSPVPGGHAPLELNGQSHTPVELDGPSHAPLELDGHTTAELSVESGRRTYYD